jgi:hypothetical protein
MSNETDKKVSAKIEVNKGTVILSEGSTFTKAQGASPVGVSAADVHTFTGGHVFTPVQPAAPASTPASSPSTSSDGAASSSTSGSS